MGRLVRRRHVTGSAPDEAAGRESEPFNFTRDVVEARAAETQRRALRFVDAQGVIDKRTFDDVAGAAGRWTALLRSRGLSPGDRVVVLSRCTWRYKRTGKVVSTPKADSWRLADGKAVEYFEYYDTAQVHAAVA